MRRKYIAGFLIGLSAFLLIFSIRSNTWFENLEANTWDWRVSTLADSTAASQEIVVILVDQASLDWAQKEFSIYWPWPRELYSLVTDYCQKSGAKSIAYDVLFTGPSVYGAADDLSFGAQIKDHSVRRQHHP
jgi:adenylate cyclase